MNALQVVLQRFASHIASAVTRMYHGRCAHVYRPWYMRDTAVMRREEAYS